VIDKAAARVVGKGELAQCPSIWGRNSADHDATGTDREPSGVILV
jgi:hypothetical protein